MPDTFFTIPRLPRRLREWADARAARQARPVGSLRCAACDKLLVPGEGAWFPQWRVVACEGDCTFIVQGNNF